MNKFKDPSFAGLVNNWIQSIGILIAAAWGVYTFIYLDIIVPQNSPVNVSLDLEAKKTLPERFTSDSLITIQIDVKAQNPSHRTVKLLPSIWLAYGKTANSRSTALSFESEIYTALNTYNEMYVEKYVQIDRSDLIAGGNLFHDNMLTPKESKSRNFVFFVPNKKYDFIEVKVIIPHSERDNVSLEWVYNHEQNAPFSEIYTQSRSGERIRMSDEELKEFRSNDYGIYSSSAVIPLGLERPNKSIQPTTNASAD